MASGRTVYGLKKSGEKIPLEIGLSKVTLDDGTVQVVATLNDITEKKKIEDKLSETNLALEEEKQNFENFVNLAPVGIAINNMEDGSFKYVNSEFSKFTGYKVDELNKMDYWQLTPKKYEQEEQYQHTSMTDIGHYGPYQKEYIHKEGHHYPVVLSGIRIKSFDGKDYIWSVVQDISEQQKNEKKLRESKERADLINMRMSLANDSAGIGVWEWDLPTNVFVWDEWMFKIYGIEPSDFSGDYEDWEGRVHPDDIEDVRTKLKLAVAGKGKYDPEFRVVHPDGQIRTLKANAEVLRDKQGKAFKVTGVNYDISDSVETLEKLALAKNEAEKLSRVKSEFLANMSHEIRTPMNGIIGLNELLLGTSLTDTQKEWAVALKASADSLMTIINDILDISKIESGKINIESVEFDLTQLLHQIESPSRVNAKNKLIDFSVATHGIENNHFIGDPTRIKQILFNLVNNAIKFTESGSVSVHIFSTDSLSDNRCRLSFEVRDTGIGISAEQKSRLFERFSQADNSTTRRVGGTGLGLNISKQLVELMDGNIGFDSEQGKGSTFWFNLTLERASMPVKSGSAKTNTLPERLSRSVKALLVEDNRINQMVAEHILQEIGVESDTAENGLEAIKLLETHQYDIIFMDCHMPVMDGFEATKKIRNNIKYKHLPIVAITAGTLEQEHCQCIDSGMNAVITKPFKANDIIQALELVK
jgi:PAS domain S-box-containing protein